MGIMKYKLINTDLIYKGALYSEGCILEIDSKDADSISEYLKPIESHPEPADLIVGLVSGSSEDVVLSPKQKKSKSNKGKKR